MNRKEYHIIIFFLFLMGLQASLHSQEDRKEESEEAPDSLSLRHSIAKAKWDAHMRSFFMSTVNEGTLKDDYALASGAGIGVLTKPFYGFQAGMSGFFIYNISSSSIYARDMQTGMGNRYELGLFDIERPTNRNDLDRLEELYLKYNFKGHHVTAGKINLSTPFFNPQDGRMRPTVEEGIWLSLTGDPEKGLEAGWITSVSPRSTVRWFSLSESMGVYGQGVNPDGSKAAYRENITGSSGMGILHLYYVPSKKMKLNFWDGTIENVLNTAMAEIHLVQERKKWQTYESLLVVRQDAINNGGNADQALTFISKGAHSNVVSTRAGVNHNRSDFSVNYTRITAHGRYLMPREWGREIFYTTLPRERIEGAGNVHAVAVKSAFALNKGFDVSAAYAWVRMPDVKDHRLNKYGLPSFHQLNLQLDYHFSGIFRGLNMRFLMAAKLKGGDTYNDPEYTYNKVNMINFNLIMDFRI